MCYQKHIDELDNLAKQMCILHREITVVDDPLKARSALDTTLDRLELAALKLPQHYAVAVNAAQQAHNLASEAYSILHNNLSQHVDPDVVAASLLIVARVRLQQACWSLERGEWYREARWVREID